MKKPGMNYWAWIKWPLIIVLIVMGAFSLKASDDTRYRDKPDTYWVQKLTGNNGVRYIIIHNKIGHQIFCKIYSKDGKYLPKSFFLNGYMDSYPFVEPQGIYYAGCG